LDLYAATVAGQAQLRQYLMELAAAKDSELETIDTEAQACRAELMKRPDPAPKPAALRVNRPAQAAVGSAKPAVPAKPSAGKAK
jgi:hypothetical protein